MKEYIAIFVRNLQTGRVEHHEIFESTGVPADALTKKISSRTDALHAKFRVEQYDVFWEGYGSIDAIRRNHPELPI